MIIFQLLPSLQKKEIIEKLARQVMNSLIFFLLSEFDPNQPPRLNEKVLKDKRKKLIETLERVISLYVSIFY